MKNALYAVVITIALMQTAMAQPATRHDLSTDEARNLVRETMPAKTKRLPQFTIEKQDTGQNDPRYYYFEAYWAGSPEGGSMMIGFYAVDPSTGDVFNMTVTCSEYDNPALRQLQTHLRAKIGLSDAEYLKIKTKGPFCEK